MLCFVACMWHRHLRAISGLYLASLPHDAAAAAKLQNPRAQPFASVQALGELTLFMPTAAAAKGDGDWGAWAPAWLDAWSLIAHCDFWDRHWMPLFSRLAKHDTRSTQPPLTVQNDQ